MPLKKSLGKLKNFFPRFFFFFMCVPFAVEIVTELKFRVGFVD